MSITLRYILALAFFGAILTGCATSPAATEGSHKELIVFAAASLTEPFNELAGAFSAAGGGVKVVFNYGGSNSLRAQIEQGAPAGVFASANKREMNTLVKEDLVVGNPSVFARNRLVVITPRSNPGKIDTLQDLAKDRLKIVAAGPNVPVGAYMLQMLDKMSADPGYGSGFKDNVVRNIISQETDVKQVVAKVRLGEGDAGVVYSTDITSQVAHDVNILDVPDPYNVMASYPIAAIKGAREADLARTFVDYVCSAEGQGILRKYNFVPPR